MREVALRGGDEQGPLVPRRAVDHLPQHVFGVLRPASTAQRHGNDPEVLGLEDGILELTVHRQRTLCFSDRDLGLTPYDEGLRPTGESLGLELPVAQALGLPHRCVGGLHRLV